MIKSLAHVCIHSTDLARTEAFYCGVLGLKIQFRFLRDGKLIGFYLRISDSQFIEVFYRPEVPSPEHPAIGHFCLEVDDVGGMCRRLSESGVKATEPKMGADHSWQAWCRDPDGVSIEFHQYTAQSTQITGEDCVVDW
jgi:catechol 2,3-dioxygenase-like lactoylglutathione lyase family enzyme